MRMEQGTGGSAVYQALYDFAKNNDLKVNGGMLSDVNILRRTENMYASGMRHGTLEHLEISKDQLRSLPEERQISQYEFDALPFKEQMSILSEISQLEIEARFKDAARYGFDNEKGSFTVDGAPLSYAEFIRDFSKSAAADVRGDKDVSKSAFGRGVGGSTITRYALAKATEGGLHNAKLAKYGEDGLRVPADTDPFLYQKAADTAEMSSPLL